jgi:Ca-activated chloride channel homolog
MIRTLLALALAATTTSGPAIGQVFSSRVESVRADVLVTDGREVILGLGPQDFEILDNGVPQKVDLLTFEKLPLNIVLALDMSGSIRGERLEQLRDAARAVVDGLEPDDQIAVITFSRDVSLHTRLTGDRAVALAALSRPSEGGDTSLIDAIQGALVASESSSGRPLAIVFSDGADTGSFLHPDAVVAAAKRGEAVLYAAAVSAARRTNFLRDVTSVTGGRLMDVASTRDLRAVFLRILNEFRQRYVMSFTPQGVSKDGWHRLEVRVKNRRATVSARSGYQAGGR